MIKKLVRKIILWALEDSTIHFRNGYVETNIYFDDKGRQCASPSGKFKIVKK